MLAHNNEMYEASTATNTLSDSMKTNKFKINLRSKRNQNSKMDLISSQTMSADEGKIKKQMVVT
jgi:hypothetical protein